MKQFRQGDVLVIVVEDGDFKEFKTIRESTVDVAVEGEITGHCHALVGRVTRVEVPPKDLERFVPDRIQREQVVGAFRVEDATMVHGRVTDVHKADITRDHATLDIGTGDIFVIRQVEDVGLSRQFVHD